MRIALMHDSLNPCGGAERLALAMAKALKELGHSVDLYVLEKTSWDRVERLSSYSRQVIDNEYVLPPFKMLPTLYSRLLNWFSRDVLGIHIVKRRMYDLTIATKQLLVPTFVDMLYMHFPDFIPGFDYLYYPERYLYNLYLRVYSRPLELVTRALMSIFKSLNYKPLILTNSQFSKAVIRKYLGVEPVVVYPPVDVEKYLPLASYRDRENIVVTISRLEHMKNLDVVIEVAKEVKEAKFVILGRGQSSNYYAMLIKKVKEYGLEGQVKILVDVGEEQKVEILRRAKVYLHPTKYEHFGMAIVEAMSSGLIPVVHKSGGPWMDIVTEGGKLVCGFGFETPSEAAYHIEQLINLKLEDYTSLQEICVHRALKFNFENFKKSLRKVLEAINHEA